MTATDLLLWAAKAIFSLAVLTVLGIAYGRALRALGEREP